MCTTSLRTKSIFSCNLSHHWTAVYSNPNKVFSPCPVVVHPLPPSSFPPRPQVCRACKLRPLPACSPPSQRNSSVLFLVLRLHPCCDSSVILSCALQSLLLDRTARQIYRHTGGTHYELRTPSPFSLSARIALCSVRTTRSNARARLLPCRAETSPYLCQTERAAPQVTFTLVYW